MKTKTPDSIHDGVLAFCAHICAASSPVSVPVVPSRDSTVRECFSNVARSVERSGGSAVLGWAIWEVPGVFLEAEFHAVWDRPQQGLECVTRRDDADTSLVFLPDSGRRDAQPPLSNVRFSWPKNERISGLLRAIDEFDAFRVAHTDKVTKLLRAPRDKFEWYQMRAVAAHRLLFQRG